MRKLEMIVWTMPICITLVGCGDVTVNTPSSKPIVVEVKKDRPVVIEKTVIEKPIIIEKKTEEKPIIVIEKH